MASKALQDLKLDKDQAEEIIALGVDLGAVDADDMPDTTKEKIAAATEVVGSALDAWVEDEIRPDDAEADVAEAGKRIASIFEIAGITVDDDGEVTIGEADTDNGDDEAEGAEEAFHPDDYIEGYSEFSVMTKLAKVKKLNASDDDDAAILEALAEWENEQDKPSSRVLNFIDEALGAAQGDSDETADEAGDGEEDDDSSGDGSEEPWEGYDKLSAVEVKDVLKAAKVDDEAPLTVDQVEYVLEYEQNREKPAPRKRVIEFCQALLDEMRTGKKADTAVKATGSGRGKTVTAPASSNGTIVITRDQILMALANGEVEIEV